MNNRGVQIVRINGDSWRIEDNGVRFFLLEGTRKAALIDSGMTVRNAAAIARGLTALPLILINTHADPDHIGGNAEFGECRMHPDEEALYRRNGGTSRIVPIREGDAIDLGDRRLEVIGLPGHTPGSIALLDVSGRVLISGDPIQQGMIFMFGEHRDLPRYRDSLLHLAQYRPRFDAIWPSHGVFPVGTEMIDYVRECAEQILSGTAQGHPVDFHGRTIVKVDFGRASFLCDRAPEKGAAEGRETPGGTDAGSH